MNETEIQRLADDGCPHHPDDDQGDPLVIQHAPIPVLMHGRCEICRGADFRSADDVKNGHCTWCFGPR